jgi:hypothetical protein
LLQQAGCLQLLPAPCKHRVLQVTPQLQLLLLVVVLLLLVLLLLLLPLPVLPLA